LFHLQVTIRNRLNKHEHRTLIKNFCNRIKNRFVDARERKRQNNVSTSNERKQQWYDKFQKKLFFENRTINAQRAKVYKKIFNNKWKQIWIAYQTKYSRDRCLTLTKDITIKRLKRHKKLIKFKNNLATQIRTNRIKLINYLFNKKVLKIISFACFYDWIKQNVKYIVLHCLDHTQSRDNMLKKENTTNFRRFMIIVKEIKTIVNWFMKTNLFAHFSLTTKLLKWFVAQCDFL
jgi:hypothetical protein